METPSTRVLQPPGGGANISLAPAGSAHDGTTYDLVVTKREAADKRNKSSIFEDGENDGRCIRKERPGDDSGSNIFGGGKSALTPRQAAAPGSHRPPTTSSPYGTDEVTSNGTGGDLQQQARPVKDYMKSTVFGDDCAAQGERRTPVKNYQRSTIFSSDEGDQNLSISPRPGSAKPKGAYNPITGEATRQSNGVGVAVGPSDRAAGRNRSRTPVRNPLLLQTAESTGPPDTVDTNTRAPSPLSTNRQRNREGTYNPITGATYDAVQQVVAGGDESGLGDVRVGGRARQPPGGASTRPW